MKTSIAGFVAGLIAGGLLVLAAIPNFNGNAYKKAGFYEKPSWRVEPGLVRVAGLMINGVTKRAPQAEAKSGFGQRDELAFQGSFAKSRVALQLRNFARGEIIDLDREASTLTRWLDSSGRDLRGKNELGGPFEFFTRITEARDGLVCHLQSKQLPHESSTHFELEGELALRVADERGAWSSKAHAFEKGEDFVAGAFTLTLQDVVRSDENGKGSLTVLLESDPSSIDSWKIVDNAGREHALKRRMSMSGGGTWTLSFASETPLPETGLFRLEGWDKARVVRVPFALRAGFGLR